jgi:hypothetical protein
MLALVVAVSAVLQVQVNVSTSRDTVSGQRSAGASIRVGSGQRADSVRRIPVTEQHLATAFDAPATRTLLERVRVARFVMDSALQSYDAKAYQRISVNLGVREAGRERLAAREEAAGRIQFQRGVGGYVDLLGRRTTTAFDEPENSDSLGTPGQSVPIPYFPGSDDLWIGGSIARVDVDERQIVHPLARGSEAYYRYALGDSTAITLPDGRRIVLQELRVQAREPRWNLIVGSFWFDAATARLVRAAYRMSVDLDVWEVASQDDDDPPPALVRGLISPLKGGVELITIEYALFEGRFWLPVSRAAEGRARASFLRVPFSFEERFVYQSVNGPVQVAAASDSVPAALDLRGLRDSLTAAGVTEAPVRDSIIVARQRALTIGIREARGARCKAEPDGSALQRSTRYGSTLPVIVRVPCDLKKLALSPELPASPYDANEEIFDASGREDLRKALDFGLQAGWTPQPVRFEAGAGVLRYNRVEGASAGLGVTQQLGAGYSWRAALRGSLGDRQLNGELSAQRSNGPVTLAVSGYRRLVSSNDWGDPFTLGASLANALYARDEGLYHRAWGGDLRWTRQRAGRTTLRAFVEEQWDAPVTTRWTLFEGNGDDRFIGNLAAQRGTFAGAALRYQRSAGLDPRGWRLDSDLRLEGATGSADYGRAAADFTVSHGLPFGLISAVTAAAGTSVGDLPPQRQWYLGGLQTVRGQTAATAAGNAFWLVRSEIARDGPVRRALFADLGWAGSRDAMGDVGRPLSGVGAGLSVLDGLFRVDVARGLFPREQWRVDLSLGARF